MAFDGYLIRIGGHTSDIEKYIVYRSYHVSKKPLDMDSNRDGDGVLKRTVLDHVPFTVSFDLRSNLNNTDVQHFMSVIRGSYTVARERKLPLTFYNPEDDNYITQDVYMVDPDFVIDHIDKDKKLIFYKDVKMKFIGY